jgi:alpha-ketoglutarate-dependent taurine dioxygenase
MCADQTIGRDEESAHGKIRHLFMNKSFLPSLDVVHCTLAVDSVAALRSSEVDRFRSIFLKYGFALIQEPPGQQDVESLLSLKALFGSVHVHDRAAPDGIARIEFNSTLRDYLGCSNAEHPPHTDGTFDSSPPRIVCLQCIRNAEEGGHSILLCGSSILDHLIAHNRQNLKPLFDHDALTVERKGQTFTGPVFSRRDGNYSVRFRSDSSAALRVKSSANIGFESMKTFVLNPSNQLRFHLKPGQTMVLDNSTVLHGRTAFQLPSSRCLNRLNFDGNTQFCQTLNLGFMPDEVIRFD